MTPSGLIASRHRRSRSWLAASWRTNRARVAVREPSEKDEFGGLPELGDPGPEYDFDARALLDSVLKGPVDGPVRDRFVAETRGNPLALLELSLELTPAEIAGGFGLPDARPLSSRIEEGFARMAPTAPSRNPQASPGRSGRAHR